MTEAEAMDDMLPVEGGIDEGEEHFQQELEEKRANTVKMLKRARNDALKAEVGSTIQCAQCGKRIVKKHPKGVFCTNQRNYGKGNCKDRWNNRVKALLD
jgi:hypothetical protein